MESSTIFTFLVRGTDKCKLFCRVQHSSAYYLLASSVIDGTPCGANTFHKCVSGQCIPAGCDHVLGSGKELGKLAETTAKSREKKG